MVVRRIVTNIAALQSDAARDFYEHKFGLTVARDQGWIITLVAQSSSAAPQVSIATEGGSGTPVPDISIEVDDFGEMHTRVLEAGHPIESGLTREPWGSRASSFGTLSGSW